MTFVNRTPAHSSSQALPHEGCHRRRVHNSRPRSTDCVVVVLLPPHCPTPTALSIFFSSDPTNYPPRARPEKSGGRGEGERGACWRVTATLARSLKGGSKSDRPVGTPLKDMTGVTTVLLLALSLFVTASWGSCPAACNFNGNCSVTGRCSCFSGWEGNDCGLRSCPVGYNVADIAYAKDSAHVLETCSGRGVCEHATSTCICEPGWSGYNCGKSACTNGCSGRGQCISLGVASTIYDGYLYNHTTSYTRWDADTIYGCKCDTGYSGADCQERVCESGLDPRRATGTPHEIVTLVCTCLTSACGGKFKLRFLGSPIKTWLYPTSRAYEVANALMVTFGNSSLHSIVPVIAYNRTANDAVCPTKAGEVRRTRIKFRRNAGDVPAISFYGNLITSGSMYFEVRGFPSSFPFLNLLVPRTTNICPSLSSPFLLRRLKF